MKYGTKKSDQICRYCGFRDKLIHRTGPNAATPNGGAIPGSGNTVVGGQHGGAPIGSGNLILFAMAMAYAGGKRYRLQEEKADREAR